MKQRHHNSIDNHSEKGQSPWLKQTMEAGRTHTTTRKPRQASGNPSCSPSPMVQCITSGALWDKIWTIVRSDKWVMPVYKASMVFLSYVAHWSFWGFIYYLKLMESELHYWEAKEICFPPLDGKQFSDWVVLGVHCCWTIQVDLDCITHWNDSWLRERYRDLLK